MQEIIIQVLQDQRGWILRVIDLVEQGSKKRDSGLKAFQNIALVLQAKMTDAFDNDRILAGVTVQAISSRRVEM
jgi:hypothetical protein